MSGPDGPMILEGKTSVNWVLTELARPFATKDTDMLNLLTSWLPH